MSTLIVPLLYQCILLTCICEFWCFWCILLRVEPCYYWWYVTWSFWSQTFYAHSSKRIVHFGTGGLTSSFDSNPPVQLIIIMPFFACTIQFMLSKSIRAPEQWKVHVMLWSVGGSAYSWHCCASEGVKPTVSFAAFMHILSCVCSCMCVIIVCRFVDLSLWRHFMLKLSQQFLLRSTVTDIFPPPSNIILRVHILLIMWLTIRLY